MKVGEARTEFEKVVELWSECIKVGGDCLEK
jgi:hypothetical protein